MLDACDLIFRGWIFPNVEILQMCRPSEIELLTGPGQNTRRNHDSILNMDLSWHGTKVSKSITGMFT